LSGLKGVFVMLSYRVTVLNQQNQTVLARQSIIQGLRGYVTCFAHISPGFDHGKMLLTNTLEKASVVVIPVPEVSVFLET